jgi:hypothetical protein
MAYTHEGITYSSKKHPMLEFIFNKYNPERTTDKVIIQFTLLDISEGYRACNIPEPASISNTILDLTRKRRPIGSRLPESIHELGYDLRKKTGNNELGLSFAGEFVFVSVGEVIDSWLAWPDSFAVEDTFIVSSINVPAKILPFVRNDEGALFSIMDYCDLLSEVFEFEENSIIRIQNPLKWQPNEIDGFYIGTNNGEDILFPIEAKALTTGDDINLEQMLGAIRMLHLKYTNSNLSIQPLAVRMVSNGIHIAVFDKYDAGTEVNILNCIRRINVSFAPAIASWS